jgi:hypothetical protein
MTRIKHVFRQDVPCLRYAALGDTAVRALTIHHIIKTYDLDALVVPQPNPGVVGLWELVIGRERVIADPRDIPPSHRDARVSAPTPRDWEYGWAAWNVFESVMWENGFFDTARLQITPPVVFPCDHRGKAAMIYPNEVTDGNRVFDSDRWLSICRALREQGYALHFLGSTSNQALRSFYDEMSFDRVFEPNLEGLRDCVAASTIAVGASTGPTWALFLSDIPQIVLQSHRSPPDYWFFDRCQAVLTKQLVILPTVECAIATAGRYAGS